VYEGGPVGVPARRGQEEVSYTIHESILQSSTARLLVTAVCTTTADERRRSDDWRTDRACVSTCSGGACGGCESRHTPTREELVSIQGYPASRLIGWGPVQEVQHAGFEQRSVLPHPSSTCRSCREVRRAACGVGRCRISPFGNAEFRGSFSLSFSSPGAGFSPFWVGASV
jgi:hypothetical protein